MMADHDLTHAGSLIAPTKPSSRRSKRKGVPSCGLFKFVFSPFITPTRPHG